ncbi:response regulator [Arsukibacterium sp.]|uniref:response regulator n=1 Tax=Arsukibacterium sp. TaxID=1977258 RepID=UPI00299E10BF|nr:response regulator [Arsukibacterium sp.]MDX1539030.1 response regulator [Arsukibacterium sp.]
MTDSDQQNSNVTKSYVIAALMILITFLLAAWFANTQRASHFQSRLNDFQLLQLTKQQLLQQEAERKLELAVDLIAADPTLQQLLLQAAERYQQQGPRADLSAIRQQLLPILNGYWQKVTLYGASQLHLHLAPDAFTLLRAHRPERHSDSLISIRPLVMHSLTSATRVTGTELGRHGLSLRAVVPVFNSQQDVQAAIELGFDLQSVFASRQQYYATSEASAGDLVKEARQGMVLLVKPTMTTALYDDVRAKWLTSALWDSPSPSDMLQFWLNNKRIPENVSSPQQLILDFNERTFAVSLLPWPVWGQYNQQNGQLVSLSWHDISTQVNAQQRTDKIIWLIWLAACLSMLFLVVLLVTFLRRQARREVSQQQKLVKQSEQKLSALYQLSPLPILLNRFSDGAFVEANPAMEKLTGYSLAEVKQLSYWDLTPERYAAAEQEQLNALTEYGRYGPYIKQYRHKNGELIDIELNGVLFSDDRDEKFIWTIISDIRELKRLEKLKEDFVSTVSHELRTPLTSIGGSLGLVLGGIGGELSPKTEKLLRIAHKNSQRLNLLINDLLDIEKLAAGKMRFDEAPVLLPKLLHDAIEHNQPYARQLDIVLSLGSVPEVQIFVDAARIQQVLTNFLSNAIKFSRANTEVVLAAEQIAERVRISVQDQGPGITPDNQQHLFQRFSQLELTSGRAKSGTGLGLAISREIARQSGGEVGVSSTPGVGATFWLELPLYQAASSVNSEDAILVIEDDIDTAHLLCEFLKSEHYQTDWAADSKTAWQKMTERKYAAITLDLKLQNENGADFFLRLRDNPATADLPVLIISAHVEQGKLQLAALANAIDWIEKPVSPEMLSLKLGQLLSQLPFQDRNHRILHVEDDSDIVTIMRLQLENQCEYQSVATLSGARSLLATERFDLILLDLGLPDGHGISLLATIAETQGDIPVVIFSAQQVSIENKLKVQAVFSKSRINTGLLAKYLKKIVNDDDGINQ